MILFFLMFLVMGVLGTVSIQTIADCLRIEKQRKRARYYRRSFVEPVLGDWKSIRI